jgi:hypothetical protein
MRRFHRQLGAIATLSVWAAGAVFAQTQPPPGPTKPAPAASLLEQPSDLAISPTAEQCREGWNARMRWTRDQFESRCAQIVASK